MVWELRLVVYLPLFTTGFRTIRKVGYPDRRISGCHQLMVNPSELAGESTSQKPSDFAKGHDAYGKKSVPNIFSLGEYW